MTTGSYGRIHANQYLINFPVSVNPRRTISIVFHTPECVGTPSFHEREFTVPNETAKEIQADFTKCNLKAIGSGVEVSPYRMYPFKRGGEECFVALDFDEIVGLFVD